MKPKNGIRPYRAQTVAFGMMLAAASVFAAADISVHSPDKSITKKLLVQDGRIRYEVTAARKPVIQTSSMVVTLDGIELTDGVEPGRTRRSSINETYPWRGVHSRAVNRCNTAVIPLTHKESGTAFMLEERAFNDGVAFRHIIPGSSRARVPDEGTAFTIPVGSTVWHHDLGGHYEDVHQQSDISEIKDGDWAAPPVTFKLPNGLGYAAITEATLVNYSGMALQANGQRAFTVGGRLLAGKRYSNSLRISSAPSHSFAPFLIRSWQPLLRGESMRPGTAKTCRP